MSNPDSNNTITYVCGHRNPDSDSVCSALGYATLLRQIYPSENIIAAAAGPLNAQAKYILNYFNLLSKVEVITDISPRAYHVRQDQVITIYDDEPLARALELYHLYHYKILPTVDRVTGQCTGVLTTSSTMISFLRPRTSEMLRCVVTSPQTLSLTVKGRIITKTLRREDMTKPQTRTIYTISTTEDHLMLCSINLTREQWRSGIFIVGCAPSLVRFLIEQGAGIVIQCMGNFFSLEGENPSEQVSTAGDKGGSLTHAGFFNKSKPDDLSLGLGQAGYISYTTLLSGGGIANGTNTTAVSINNDSHIASVGHRTGIGGGGRIYGSMSHAMSVMSNSYGQHLDVNANATNQAPVRDLFRGKCLSPFKTTHGFQNGNSVAANIAVNEQSVESPQQLISTQPIIDQGLSTPSGILAENSNLHIEDEYYEDEYYEYDEDCQLGTNATGQQQVQSTQTTGLSVTISNNNNNNNNANMAKISFQGSPVGQKASDLQKRERQIERRIRANNRRIQKRITPDLVQREVERFKAELMFLPTLAEKYGTCLIETQLAVSSTTVLVRQSTPIDFFATHDRRVIVTENVKLSDIRMKLDTTQITNNVELSKQLQGVAVVDKEGHCVSVVTRSDVIKKNIINLVLVDHNEIAQSVAGVESEGVTVKEIIDHHKLGNEQTIMPMRFTCRPVGSTCTIVADMYKEEGIVPSPKIAGVLMAGILSDTLVFRSPTCTEHDKKVAYELSDICGCNVFEFGNKMFKANSMLNVDNKKSLVRTDYKIYELSEGNNKAKKYSISQIEVTTLKEVSELIPAFKETIDEIREEDGCFFSCIMITDIVSACTWLLCSGPENLLMDLMGYDTVQSYNYLFEMKGVLSRKKQLIPHLQTVLPLVAAAIRDN